MPHEIEVKLRPISIYMYNKRIASIIIRPWGQNTQGPLNFKKEGKLWKNRRKM